MKLVLVIIVCVAAIIVCFSLAAAAKNAERLSNLWLEKKKEEN